MCFYCCSFLVFLLVCYVLYIVRVCYAMGYAAWNKSYDDDDDDDDK